jgi:hypothetical protein
MHTQRGQTAGVNPLTKTGNVVIGSQAMRVSRLMTG